VNDERWPEAESSAVRELTAAYRVGAHMLLLAAFSFAVTAWCADFVPVNYIRNGRGDRRWVSVPGPLAEHAATVPVPVERSGLADHLGAFAAHNAQSPPLYGLVLRELETRASEENRIALFDFMPAIAPCRWERPPRPGRRDRRSASPVRRQQPLRGADAAHPRPRATAAGDHAGRSGRVSRSVRFRRSGPLLRLARTKPEIPLSHAVGVIHENWS
jgi:hypothetical protein